MINYKDYLRRVSKYDLDRGTLDIKKLKTEKERDRTQNVKIKRNQWERGIAYKKQVELKEKMTKLQILTKIREDQEEERKLTLRRKHEEFRKAIQER